MWKWVQTVLDVLYRYTIEDEAKGRDQMPEREGRRLGRLEDAGRFRDPDEARAARERAGIQLPEPGPGPEDVDRVSREDNSAMREFFREERREAGLEDAD